MELKDIQINNLKSTCIKSEQDFDALLNDINMYESNTAGFANRMKKAEYEKTKLIDDNVKLLNENEKLRKQLLNVTFMHQNQQEANDKEQKINYQYKRVVRDESPTYKENIHHNHVNSNDLSSQGGRRKRTAHFANIKSELVDHRSPSIDEAVAPYHKKSYSYLNSNLDQDSPGKESYMGTPAEEESEFEFMMSYQNTEQSQ
jgi:regulator of replication initiation timing